MVGRSNQRVRNCLVCPPTYPAAATVRTRAVFKLDNTEHSLHKIGRTLHLLK